MPPSDDRRIAADARRIQQSEAVELDRAATKRLRDALKENYERGQARGRQELQDELGPADPRALLLESSAELMDLHEARISALPNSERAMSAFREAAALLRDAAKGEEPQEVPSEETQPESGEG